MRRAASLEEAAGRHPGRADLLYWLGRARLESGAPAAAVAALGEAVAVQPAFVEAHVKLAEALEAAGRPGEAEAAYREALRRDPVHQPQAWNNLGFLLLQAQRLGEALPMFAKATALDPDLAVAHVNAGSVYLLRQQLEEAAAQFEQALAADPDYVPALGNLGLVRAQQGRYDEARALLQKLLRLQPNDARARAMLQQVEGVGGGLGLGLGLCPVSIDEGRFSIGAARRAFSLGLPLFLLGWTRHFILDQALAPAVRPPQFLGSSKQPLSHEVALHPFHGLVAVVPDVRGAAGRKAARRRPDRHQRGRAG